MNRPARKQKQELRKEGVFRLCPDCLCGEFLKADSKWAAKWSSFLGTPSFFSLNVMEMTCLSLSSNELDTAVCAGKTEKNVNLQTARPREAKTIAGRLDE
jgi:hypothetical protein